jgi:hypothetical protein
VNVGGVYVVYTALSRPPKDKIVICVGDGPPLFFWINTEPRFHGIGQMPLAATDHSALTRDCFLDCSRVTTFPVYELRAAQQRDPVSTTLADAIADFLDENEPATLPAAQRVAICAILRDYA